MEQCLAHVKYYKSFGWHYLLNSYSVASTELGTLACHLM